MLNNRQSIRNYESETKQIISIYATVITMLLSIVVIIGWFTHNSFLKSIVPGTATMKFNIALGFVFSSAALLLYYIPGKNKTRHRFFVFISVIVSLIGLLTFAEYFFDINIGIDEFFVKDDLGLKSTFYPGRMSPLAAINFLLIGIGLLLLNNEKTAIYQFFYLSGIAFISLLMLVGFNFIADIPTFINLSGYDAIGFIMISGAIYFAQPMLQKKISFEHKLFTNFTAFIILIVVLSLFSSYYSDQRIRTAQWVKHTNDVLNETSQILLLAEDVQGEGSGYIITGDSSYLHYFMIAKDHITNHNKKLKELTKNDGSQQVKIDSLSLLIDKRIGFSLQSIQTRNEKGFEAAQVLIASGEGKSYMNAIRKISAEIQRGENNLLIQRQKENNMSIVSFNRAFFVLLGSIFISIIIILFSIRRNIEVRKKAAEKIRESEHMFSTLFYKSPVLKAIVEASTKSYIEINDAFIDFWGDTKKNILGKTLKEINILGEEHDEILQNIHKYGSVRELEMLITSKNDNVSWVSANIDTVNLKGKDCFLFSGTDITKRKIAEDNLLTLSEELESIVFDRTQELIRSEKSYRYLFENNPMPMWIIDLETFKFLDINEMAILQYGYSREEFLSMTALDIRQDEERAAFKQSDHSFKIGSTDYNKGIWNHVKKDQTVIQVEIIGHEIVFEGIQARFILANDVTERMEAEEKLRKSESLFRAMIENNEGIIALLDPKLKTIYRSPASDRITGWTSEEGDILNPQKQIHPEDTRYVADVLKKALANPGKTLNTIFRTKHKNGNYIWLEGVFTNMIHDPSVGAIITNLRDITSRKQAEEKLIASEKRFRHTLDTMMEGAQIIGFDWRYKYVNDSMAKHGKYSKEELLGHTVMEKYPDIEQSDIYKVYQQCFQERVAIHLENEFTFPDKSKAWFELSFQPVTEGIFILSIDITDRKKAQFEIQQLNEELEQKVLYRTEQLETANKELEAFSYSVSHDLRAPLRAINGFAKMIGENYDSAFDNEGKRLFNRIKANALKMGLLIDDLLEFSRLGRKEIHKTPIQMTELVEAAVSEINTTITHEATINIHELHSVNGDGPMIKQVMINLLSNALKYSSKKDNPFIEIKSCFSDNEVIYSVSDNGAGFNNQFVHKLFGVFQRLHLKADFEGTGVGLALVKRIINKHGGRVWAEGELNKGATFFFSLPATNNN